VRRLPVATVRVPSTVNMDATGRRARAAGVAPHPRTPGADFSSADARRRLAW